MGVMGCLEDKKNKLAIGISLATCNGNKKVPYASKENDEFAKE
jgi:hypothetical protein